MLQASIIAAAGIVQDSPSIRASLERTSTFGDEYRLYKDNGDGTLSVPRNLCQSASDLRSKGYSCSLGDLSFKPRNETQMRVMSRGSELIGQGWSFVLEAGTGVGKTVLSLALAHRLGVTTLVVVDQENIMTQWINRIREFLGLPDEKIGRIQGDTCRYKDCPITIAMVHSLCKEGRYPSEVYNHFGFTIFDEVHVMGAETFNNAGYLVNSYWRMGLSATPNRKDGKDELFKAHIGPILIQEGSAPLVPKVILSASGWNCPTKAKQNPDGSWSRVKVPHSPSKCAHIVKSLTNSQIRTRLIANFTYQAYRKNRNIVIFSDLKDAYLPKIKQALIERGVKSKDIGFYVGGMKSEALDKASRRSVVLTTYKMTAKAVDCPWWDTAVLATPKSDARQVIGRILREYPGKVDASQIGSGVIPIVFDVADLDSPIFKNYYKARLRYYREIGVPFGGDTRLLNLR